MKIRHLTVLNTREVKEIHQQLEQRYGYKEKLPFAFLQSNKDKIYVVHHDVDKIDLNEIKVDTLGMYFATLHYFGSGGSPERKKEYELRLSMEGSQLIGPHSGKNVLDITKEQAKSWFRGEDLEVPTELEGFYIIRNQKDYLGCGKASHEKLYNYLPKTRRIVPEHTPNESPV